MTILEFLASQLDKEATQYDNQKTIGEDIEFWQLCLEAKRLLIDEETLKQEKEEPPEAGEIKLDIQRYKGLGEMNPQQLWETTMDPQSRMLKQVTIENAESANEIFDILMGTDVEPRKNFIQTHAKAVKNLDI